MWVNSYSKRQMKSAIKMPTLTPITDKLLPRQNTRKGKALDSCWCTEDSLLSVHSREPAEQSRALTLQTVQTSTAQCNDWGKPRVLSPSSVPGITALLHALYTSPMRQHPWHAAQMRQRPVLSPKHPGRTWTWLRQGVGAYS